jgi:hypothetical protein
MQKPQPNQYQTSQEYRLERSYLYPNTERLVYRLTCQKCIYRFGLLTKGFIRSIFRCLGD